MLLHIPIWHVKSKLITFAQLTWLTELTAASTGYLSEFNEIIIHMAAIVAIVIHCIARSQRSSAQLLALATLMCICRIN